MKWNHSKHFYRKLLLIFVIEVVVFFVLKFLVSIIGLPLTITLQYIVFGGLLAYVIMSEYDKRRTQKQVKLRKELNVLSDLARNQYKRFLIKDSEANKKEIEEKLRKLEEEINDVKSN